MYIKDPQTQLDRRKPQWLPASYQTLCSNIPLPLHSLHSSYSSFSSTCFSSWPSKSLMNRLLCFTGYPSLAVPSLMESIHSSSSLIARRRCVDRALSLSNSTDCRSTATSSPSFYWAGRSRSILGQREINSFSMEN